MTKKRTEVLLISLNFIVEKSGIVREEGFALLSERQYHYSGNDVLGSNITTKPS
jgi:hypothetical protein